MKGIITMVFATFCFQFVFAQINVSEKEYLQQVLLHHPIAKQAILISDIGESELLKAKGWLDPKLKSNFDQKSFDGKTYYNLLDNTAEIPTWIGLDVKVNYSNNNGQFLNPENNLPATGLWSAGISLPVLQGLVFDKRRADLQKAKNYVQLAELERQQLLNQLLFDASKAYWDWYLQNELRQIADQGVALASVTFEGVKQSYLLGDKPGVDTLEALIQVQNRQMFALDADLQFQNATLWATSFLWTEDAQPAMLMSNALPESTFDMEENVDEIISNAATLADPLWTSNPKLQQYEWKISNTEIETKLKKEMLKPALDVGYNFLNQPFENSLLDQFDVTNRKWNVQFSMPLIFRKERGELKILKAELESLLLEYENTKWMQQTKINAVINKLRMLQNQLVLNEKNVTDNAELVQAERRKFEFGESSVFLVNYREIAFLKVLQKQAETQAKIKVALAEYYFETGLFGSE